MTKPILTLLLALVGSVAAAAGPGPKLLNAGTNISDTASLQRGAQLYFNYCASCHSLQYMRYSRMAEDLELTEDQVMKYLNFTGAKFGETITTNMPVGAGEATFGGEDWFGKAPPDLSLVARARNDGPNWIYTYLLSFYPDPSRPVGWNNTVFPNASMPHVMWDRQGVQVLVQQTDDAGQETTGFDLIREGSRSPEQYRQDARDVATFLEYVGEPAALQRERYGLWVLLYLLLFTGVAYLLKHEYWKDVH